MEVILSVAGAAVIAWLVWRVARAVKVARAYLRAAETWQREAQSRREGYTRAVREMQEREAHKRKQREAPGAARARIVPPSEWETLSMSESATAEKPLSASSDGTGKRN